MVRVRRLMSWGLSILLMGCMMFNLGCSGDKKPRTLLNLDDVPRDSLHLNIKVLYGIWKEMTVTIEARKGNREGPYVDLGETSSLEVNGIPLQASGRTFPIPTAWWDAEILKDSLVRIVLQLGKGRQNKLQQILPIPEIDTLSGGFSLSAPPGLTFRQDEALVKGDFMLHVRDQDGKEMQVRIPVAEGGLIKADKYFNSDSLKALTPGPGYFWVAWDCLYPWKSADLKGSIRIKHYPGKQKVELHP